MVFGVIREITPQERRVAVTPEGARTLCAAGHTVMVEGGAGTGSGYTDTEYLAAGAQIGFSAREVAQRAQVLVKVHTPTKLEWEMVRPESTLVGFLHLANAGRIVHQRMAESQLTALALELLREGEDYPLHEPMSAIGGRVAVTLATWHLSSAASGPGVLLGGSAGVPPALVLVIGAGTAGAAAAADAASLGAQVVVLDRDPRRLTRLERALPGRLVTAIASEYHLARYIEQADVVIGAVAVRGEPAPKVVRRQHVRTMKESALLIDLSIDEGGCAETSHPTTPEEPVYEAEGVRHICIPNLPSQVARTSSSALGVCLLPYLLQVGEGVDPALAHNEGLRSATVLHRGRLVGRSLRRYVDLPFVDLDTVVPRED